ncbi:glycine zipper family protein [Flavobacterium sp.]|uniref:glycine zipper family protein n=1 Tax=Flavobacterium sp. TaxID=239 RepID=UPI002B9F8BBF|nr:glycine zipper family protein [Flavobacterium sp.]HSD06845.1 hypothetical protein [Flavobacterium sp.]
MKTLSIIFLALVITSCQKQQNEAINKAKQNTIDSMRIVTEKQRAIDSIQLVIAKMKEEEHDKAVAEVKHHATSETKHSTQAVQEAPAKKKGWSGAAKGAVIGAGVGAATGAVVSHHKKGEAAIIGGIVGAGVGAGTGAIIDDSKKKKEEQK